MTTSVRGKKFRYGMKTVGFGSNNQPLEGFLSRSEDKSGKYKDIITYNRRLTRKELQRYDLDDLNRGGKKRLTIIREEKNVKQADLAAMLNISVRTIQGWELNGMGSVSLNKCARVARALGVSVDDLVEPMTISELGIEREE